MTIGKKTATILISSLLIGAAAPAWAAVPADNSAALHQEAQSLDELASAKQLDWQYALDPSVAPVRRDDLLDQMNKADRAIKLITHGFAVPEQELADALWTPPKAITPAAREGLIRELQEAKRADGHNEQKMFGYAEWSTGDGGGAPVDTVTFDQQMQLVDGVIKNLEIGEEVHWAEIRQALYVPPSID
jgi:hypothetical protein